MRLRRFRIAWLMLAVLIAALDFGAMRATVEDYGVNRLFLPCVVALPMLNLLAVGLLLIFLRPAIRPFLVGFEVFGVSALAPCIYSAWGGTEGWLLSYLEIPTASLITIFGPPIGQEWSLHGVLMVHLLASLWATWPQLAFSMLGGLLNRNIGCLTWIAEHSLPPEHLHCHSTGSAGAMRG